MQDLRPHRRLDVWQKSMELAKCVYDESARFPKSEVYGLTSQMRRAAVSLPSNLAEGAGRKGPKEFKQFLNIAQGSASELDTQLELAHMLGFLKDDNFNDLTQQLTRISKMLYGLARSINVNQDPLNVNQGP